MRAGRPSYTENAHEMMMRAERMEEKKRGVLLWQYRMVHDGFILKGGMGLVFVILVPDLLLLVILLILSFEDEGLYLR